jgi:chemotaxis protein CheZ
MSQTTTDPLEQHRAATIELLHAAISALEGNDQEAFDKLIENIVGLQRNDLAVGVARLARRVHDAMREINLDTRLTDLTASDIPDARTRLDYVITVTEQAAHRTLDLVDESRRLVGDVERLAQTPHLVGSELVLLTHAIRHNLSELSQAQEYQDLSGQMIRKVIVLVHEVENALIDLLGIAGVQLKNAAQSPIPFPSTNPLGPGPKAASQQDADALLADLGF